jgi:hypothetical protein
MALKVPQTHVHKKLGMSTVVAWDLAKCLDIATKTATAALDISSRKMLPSHVVIEDGVQSGAVTLPDAKAHDSRAIVVINNDAAEAVLVGGVSCVAQKATTIYSDGTNWVKLVEVGFA